MSKKVESGQYTTEENVTKYQMLSPMLETIYTEMKELSKKKQDVPLNKLKVDMINKILEKIKELLADEPTLQFVDLLDDETLPSNSDAVLVLAQFRSAMDQFKGRYFRKEPSGYNFKWFTQ